MQLPGHAHMQLLCPVAAHASLDKHGAAETAVLPCSKHLQCIYVDREFKKGDIQVRSHLLPVAGVHVLFTRQVHAMRGDRCKGASTRCRGWLGKSRTGLSRLLLESYSPSHGLCCSSLR